MSTHRYPRTARVKELLHQIVADEIERLDDDRLELVTVMNVEVEPDLRHATVYVDTPTGAHKPETDRDGNGDWNYCRKHYPNYFNRHFRAPANTASPRPSASVAE